MAHRLKAHLPEYPFWIEQEKHIPPSEDGMGWQTMDEGAMTDNLGQIRKATEELVEVYALRVATVVKMIAEAYEMMDHLKETRETLRRELQEMLALNSSFRRRDFDSLMQQALEPEREKHLKNILHQFQLSQQARTAILKEALQTPDLHLVRKLKNEMQEEVDQVSHALTLFQQDQSFFLQGLRSLLTRGSKLTLKEFKASMGTFKAQVSNSPLEGSLGH